MIDALICTISGFILGALVFDRGLNAGKKLVHEVSNGLSPNEKANLTPLPDSTGVDVELGEDD